jgi:hydrogenase/urease accessory protein HupE
MLAGDAFGHLSLTMVILRFLLGLFFVLSPFSLLRAHQVASVELEFQNVESHWRLLGAMDIAYMLPETRNIPGGPPLSREATMKAPPEELARIRRETENTLRKLLRFTFAGKDVGWRVEFPDFEKEPFELPEEAGDVALISTRLLLDQVPGGGELRVHWAGEQETELIVLIEESADQEGQIMSTLPGGNLLLLNVAAAGQPTPVKQAESTGWLSLGYRHVIPKGLDHLLFILGLFLLAPRWKPLMGQSLLFTLAHSVTLSLAVLGVVTLPTKFVEVMIAVSIAWIGVENLITRKLGKQRLILVFCFGLLHGLGFASVLAEKLQGVSSGRLALPLIGFNIGVELAQITVLIAAFLVLWPLKKWSLQVQMVGSAFVALAGIGWVIERLWFS